MIMTVMNLHRGGAFGDESFGVARAKALQAFVQVFGPESSEWLAVRSSCVLGPSPTATRVPNAIVVTRVI